MALDRDPLCRINVPLETWARKSKGLYFLLKLRHVHGNDLCKDIADDNRFEMYRRLPCSFDPHADGQDMALLDPANRMRDTVATNVDEAYLIIR